MLRKPNFFKDAKKKATPDTQKTTHTPETIGEKWQLDVKIVPKSCYVGKIPSKFYQYTVIDEATRQWFIYPFKKQFSHNTVQLIKKAIKFFGYVPKVIQTDNGFELTHFKDTKKGHPFDVLCNELGITPKLIRPSTPSHNDKVAHSHRNDNERFYKHISFYSYDDLMKQMTQYLYKSNRLPMQSLHWLSPIEKRLSLEKHECFSKDNKHISFFLIFCLTSFTNIQMTFYN